MRMYLRHFFGIFAVFATCYTMSHASTPFSKYGVIQNVQNYSSNPFWNPNSPYNQRMPQPVYATGPDITTDECQRIVTSLVTVQCMNLNNCITTELSDIRPTIMLQLSRVSGGNYATACGGYLDGIFNDYVAQYANAAPRGFAASFPNATTPNTKVGQNDKIEIKNPFAPNIPEWANEIQERKQELMDLQSQNGTNVYGITANPFPTTYADLTFSERMENEQQGYEPYKDSVAYHSIKIADIKQPAPVYPDTEGTVAEGNDDNIDGNDDSNPPQFQDPSVPTTPTDPEKPENNEEELPEDYVPTHNKEDDLSGTYAILFRPKHEDLSLEEPFSETLSRAFWDKDCSDHAIGFIDDNAVLNRTLYKAIHNNKGKTDYFLTTNKIQGAFGILQSDMASSNSGTTTVRKRTEQEAKHLALFLQKKLQGTKCNDMEIYVIQQNRAPSGKISIEKIVAGPFVIE